MRQRAQVLPLDDARVEHVATVVDADVAQDGQPASGAVDLDDRHLGVVGEGREHRHAAALVGVVADVRVAVVVGQLQARLLAGRQVVDAVVGAPRDLGQLNAHARVAPHLHPPVR